MTFVNYNIPLDILQAYQNYDKNVNMQITRYLLFCDGGIFSVHALTSEGTKRISYK